MDNIKKLKSTSDGWRGILADTFTFKEVDMLGNAIAKYALSKGDNNKILVAYDTRFLGRLFAERLYNILLYNEIETYLTNRPIPTPLLSFRVNQLKFFCGISITASHNPYNHNGIKIRMGYGGPPTGEVVQEIEKYVNSYTTVSAYKGQVSLDYPVSDYVNHIRSLLDMDILRKKTLRVLVDPMHGVTSGILKTIFSFKESQIVVDEINSDPDPYFGGQPPEPKEDTTAELQKSVNEHGYNIGFAHDGDGDRITGSLPGIGFLPPHEIGVILLWYLVTHKKMGGRVVGSVTLGGNLNRLSQYFGLKYIEIPVGFHNATTLMRNQNILISAEENGGIGFGFYLPERDATLSACLLVEAESKVKGGIRSILENIKNLIGPTACYRLNIRTESSRFNILQQLKKKLPEKLKDNRITKITEIDGIKLTTENGDWGCIRVAGTEDLIRIYAESDSIDSAKKIADEIGFSIEQLDRRTRGK